jgi:hypothetical protein
MLLIIVLLLQSAFGAVSHASTSAPIAFDWQPDGLVTAVALTSDTVYIGRQFNYVGPSTGNFVSLNSTTGSVVPGLPNVIGTVSAIASDSSGGESERFVRATLRGQKTKNEGRKHTMPTIVVGRSSHCE